MRIWVVKKEENKLLGARFSRRGNVISLEGEFEELSPKALKGQRVALLYYPQDFYFSREIFPKTSPEILKLQIQDKLQELGLFEAPPVIRYRTDEEIGNQVEVEIAAVGGKEILNLLRFSSEIEARLERIIPEEIAIAYLSIKETNKFILSVYLSEDTFFIFLTGQGRIYYFRNVEIDPQFGINEKIIEEGLLASLDYCERILGIEIEGIIVYGSQRELLTNSPLKIYEPSFSFIKNSNLETILNFPSFFGCLFVPDNFNFIPEEQQIFLKNLNLARYIIYAFLVLSIINYGLWLTYSSETKKLESFIKLLENRIDEKKRKIEQLLPEDKKREIEEQNFLIKKYQKSFRLDEFLASIENIMPKKTKIINAKGEQKENTFSFELKTSLKGDLEDINKQLEIFYQKLTDQYNLREKIFSYNKEKKEGILIIKGEKEWQI